MVYLAQRPSLYRTTARIVVHEPSPLLVFERWVDMVAVSETGFDSFEKRNLNP